MLVRILGPLGLLACTTFTQPSPDATDSTDARSDASPSGETASPTGDTGTTPKLAIITDPLTGLPTGADQWKRLCARGHSDPVSNRFCEESAPPSIGSFAELRAFLDFEGDDARDERDGMHVSAVHHSTAVGGRFVTPLNPRVFYFTSPRGRVNPGTPQPDEAYHVLSFARGEHFAELAAKDFETGEPRFFLFRFELPCESTKDGCQPADLWLPDTEAGWTGWSLYDESDVANTTVDCLRCHQPGGHTDEKQLLMQEIGEPWNHWFYEEVNANIAAIQAFEAAHEGTRYADFPVAEFTRTRPIVLQALVQNNGGLVQPNAYPSNVINDEIEEHGTSETWDDLFANALISDAKPVPYAGNPAVDGNWDYSTPYFPVLDAKSPVAEAIRAYRAVADGTLARDQMPDIVNDIFLPEALAAMGATAHPGLDGEGLMRQVCRQCHNSRLDPELSRANFDVDALDTMSQAQKDEAIRRLQLPEQDIRHMPPQRFHTLTEAERDLIIEVLSR